MLGNSGKVKWFRAHSSSLSSECTFIFPSLSMSSGCSFFRCFISASPLSQGFTSSSHAFLLCPWRVGLLGSSTSLQGPFLLAGKDKEELGLHLSPTLTAHYRTHSEKITAPLIKWMKKRAAINRTISYKMFVIVFRNGYGYHNAVKLWNQKLWDVFNNILYIVHGKGSRKSKALKGEDEWHRQKATV